MRSTARACMPIVLVSLAAAAPHAGGAPIITLVRLPDYLVVGQPVTLDFVARQHGIFVGPELIGSATVDGQTVPVKRDGDYFRATFTPQEPRDSDIQLSLRRNVNSASGVNGFAVSSTRRLLPIQTVAAGKTPPLLPPGERGRRLFVAKGCISCHMHDDINRNGGGAPNLTNRKYARPYLEQLLNDPYSVLPERNSPFGAMPALGLSAEEIDAIAVFLTVSANGS